VGELDDLDAFEREGCGHAAPPVPAGETLSMVSVAWAIADSLRLTVHPGISAE
jgi:hypothetical protein